MSQHHDQPPHVPAPSLWPLGFAVGVACILVGLVVSWPVAAVGAAIAIVFGFLWVRDVTGGVRQPVAPVEPETRAVHETSAQPATAGDAGMPLASDEEVEAEQYSRGGFLTAATLGLGGVIGGVITVPVLGFAVLPSFTNQKKQRVDLGPLENYPEGQYLIATYMEEPEIGEVSRRTVFVRNNGLLEGQPSFTILFSRCVHLGCPVQPNGVVDDSGKKTVGEKVKVDLTPVQPAGFGCPCHGGQYDTEGNRTAGPPVRALDRAEFSIRNGHLWLGEFYSVGQVDSTGARARIQKYAHTNPGVHVDGIESWLYPIPVPG